MEQQELNTAALAFGGLIDPHKTNYNNTESYNGTSWTEVNNLNTARYNSDALELHILSIIYRWIYYYTRSSTESWDGSNLD